MSGDDPDLTQPGQTTASARMAAGESARLSAQLGGLQDALSAASGHLDERVEGALRSLIETVEERRSLGLGLTVVGLAGPTGSGKSSLFNALVGRTASPVGAHRPTTDAPHACVWGSASAGELLDWLGVPADPAHRHRPAREASALDGLVLIDLPDQDSLAADHRAQADRLLGVLDLVIWVVDPQKYADGVLHDSYLSREGRITLSPGPWLTVVINQVDRLAAADVQACADDLERLLDPQHQAGLRIITASTVTGAGIDEVYDVLADLVARRSAPTERLRVDLGEGARLVWDAEPGGTGGLLVVGQVTHDVVDEPPPPLTRAQVRQLTDALTAATGGAVRVEATETMTRLGIVNATTSPIIVPLRGHRSRRRHPLRRLGVRAAEGALSSAGSLPPASAAAPLRVDAARATVRAGTEGLPPAWRAMAEQLVTTGLGGDRRDGPEQGSVGAKGSVGGTEGDTDAVPGDPIRDAVRHPVVRFLADLQRTFTVSALVGLVWLAAAYLVEWVGDPGGRPPSWPSLLVPPGLPTYPVEQVPLPALLGGIGLVGALIVTIAGRVTARILGRRAARVEGRRLREQAATVAADAVLAPIAGQRESYARLLDALRRAEGR